MNAAIDNAMRDDQRLAFVSGLLPDIDYRFRVRAINSFGRGQEASWGSGRFLCRKY